MSTFANLSDSTNNLLRRNKSRNKTLGEVLKYPLGRTSGESEDTLLIKAIEYEPPKIGTSKEQRSSGNVNLQDELDKANLTPGTGFSASITDGSVTYDKKTKKVVSVNKVFNFVNMGGMDARVNHNASSDPRGFQEKIKYFVELPIPQQINDSNAVSWGEDSMNIMEMAAFTAATSVASGGIDGLGERFEEARTALLDGDLKTTFPGLTDDVRKGLVAALSGQALSALGTNISAQSALGRSTGQILNSNLELLFQGVTLRTFPFNITFSPRSRPESDRVKQIIRRFKKSMSAKTGRKDYAVNGGVFLKAPDVFLLRYLSNGKDHPFLNSFKPCALTNMSVNYTGAGTYATYGDATPVNIKVSLTFKEINPIYAEDYDEDNLFGNDAGKGVGF